ncbi:ctenidin-3-like [Stegodyphus dumicola]|uniref:ctenidin-3-like n=1 Tax=Stegodyphus dumicola TaxID=202533 RepID=UPI0015ABBBE1|nr:ctenidin-3-like [Stegodyphus dumicola]
MFSLRCVLVAGLISMTVARRGWGDSSEGPSGSDGGTYTGPRGPPQAGPPEGPWEGGPEGSQSQYEGGYSGRGPSRGQGGPRGPRGQGGPGGLEGQDGGSRGFRGPRRRGGHGGRGRQCLMFPACKQLSKAIQEEMYAMFQRGEGGPDNCVDGNHKVCKWNDMMTARCSMKEAIAEDCIQQVQMFINGDCSQITPGDRSYPPDEKTYPTYPEY